jgi:hypothetical protein
MKPDPCPDSPIPSIDSQVREQVDQFILAQIDSVPHLEALLLIWQSRPKRWSADLLAKRLYVRSEVSRSILQDLARQRLIAAAPEAQDQYYHEAQSEDGERLLRLVYEIYRRELVRISTMIHSKPSSSVREFAKAFRFVKEKE